MKMIKVMGVLAITVTGCTIEQDVVPSGGYLCAEGDSCQWGWTCQRDPGSSYGHCVVPSSVPDDSSASGVPDAGIKVLSDVGVSHVFDAGSKVSYDVGVSQLLPDGGDLDGGMPSFPSGATYCTSRDPESCTVYAGLKLLCDTDAFGDYGFVRLDELRVVAAESPELVSSCIFTSEARDIDYREDSTDTRLPTATADTDYPCVPIDENIWAVVSGGAWSDSSAELVGQPLGQILPGQTGAIYRTPQRREQMAEVLAADGLQVVGKIVITRWSWTPTLAFGTEPCPPIPTP